MKKIILLLIFFSCFGALKAQESLYTSGGNGSGSGGTISFSIGQVVFNTIYNSDFTIYSGAQQPFEISNTLSLENYQFLNLKLKVFPNPTKGDLKLSFKKEYENKLSYKLFDVGGKLIQTKSKLKESEVINIKNTNKALYYLSIFENTTKIKTFKIIKN